MALDVAVRPRLRALADDLGIIRGYQDQTGKEWRETSDETRVLLIAAMGFDASTEEAAEAALKQLHHEARRHALDPVRVVEIATPELGEVAVNLAEPDAGPIRWALELVEESGRIHRSSGIEAR